MAKTAASDMDDVDNEDQMSLFAPGAEGGEAANMTAATALTEGEAQVLKELREVDVNRLTPLEAMQIIYDMQEKIRNEA